MTAYSKPRSFCTPEIFSEVIEALKRGISVMQYVDIHRDDPTFPLANTIYDYCYADNARKQTYMHAREMFADASVDQTITIADTALDPQHASNRIKVRQWAASKIKPKVYGDKLDLDVTNKVDIGTAILAARKRLEPLTIDNEPEPTPPTVDPFS